MNQDNHGNNYNTWGNLFMKRKRGRPRKDKTQNPVKNYRSAPQTYMDSFRAPPGFESSANANRSSHDDTNVVVTGQVVSGFVEATFDAGYLISVTVDGSNIPLRGVVFKPGCSVPISSENDVAPEAPVIRRSHVSHSTYNNQRTPPSSKCKKQAPQMEPQASQAGSCRGTMVPVVLKPVDLSNGLPSSNEVPPVATTQAAAQIAASKGRQVPLATLQVSKEMLLGESKPLKLLGGPLETPSDRVAETNRFGSDSSNNLQHVSTKPLQTIESHVHNEYSYIPRLFEKSGADDVTEFLQENAR